MKIIKILHVIGQSIYHGLASSTVRRRSKHGAPFRFRSSSYLAKPGASEAVVLERSVPHRAPPVAEPAAVEERLGFTVDFGNPVVDLVRLNLVSAPGTHRPLKHLVSLKADLDR